MSSLRVMTYNVHGCVGTDRHLDHLRIAKVIAAHDPDVVALQELDVARERSGRNHQARLIADELKMRFHFHPALFINDEEQYGDALLSRWPLHLKHAAALPTVNAKRPFEPRGALWVGIEKDGVEYQIINTHLGLRGRERLAQIDALMGENWLSNPSCSPPRILCGDFNALPNSTVHRRVTRTLRDVQRQVPGIRPRATFPSRHPLLRLDYIFVSDDLDVQQVRVMNDALSRTASDHLPLVADLRFTDRQSTIS
jgi:endonuclease/exonuclease/phosphatase family metal-dependent hydrolase